MEKTLFCYGHKTTLQTSSTSKKELLMDRKQADHHANQLNPNNIAHNHVNDNRSNQKNPTSPVYDKGRTVPEKSVKGK